MITRIFILAQENIISVNKTSIPESGSCLFLK
jgi:hypothetical protein